MTVGKAINLNSWNPLYIFLFAQTSIWIVTIYSLEITGFQIWKLSELEIPISKSPQ